MNKQIMTTMIGININNNINNNKNNHEDDSNKK